MTPKRSISHPALLALLCAAYPVAAQQTAPQPAPAPAPTAKPDEQDDAETVIITAQKQPENLQKAPLSATVVTKERIRDADVRTVQDAVIFVPNAVITEFSARKLSNPRFRGIGSSPNNPAITTYFDGVPQLNANSSSIELLDIEQIEFVRGPQGALFGRNTVGGLINITSRRPSLTARSGEVWGSLGNYAHRDIRGIFNEPLSQNSAFRLGFGYSRRDGFTRNTVTGNDLDDRGAFFGKGQILWKVGENKEVRLLLTGERDRDGDYALNDLAAVRANPFRVTRDFEGSTRRDVVAPTLLFNSRGQSVDFSMISGLVWWKTRDVTDLDYSIAPLLLRDNREKDTQFTHEFRFASSPDAPRKLGNWGLKWQAGVTFFKQNYDQDATNTLNPPIGPLPGFQSRSQAALNDTGLGAYGQATLTAGEKFDVILGLRGDYERKKATLIASTNPPFGAPFVQNLRDSFSEVTPQIGVAYRLKPTRTLYATISDGFKAGGFNPASPPGTETYGPEKSRNFEIGIKNSFLDNRVTLNASAFYVDWKNLQLNVPFGAPGQFFIANVGSANSKGLEVEVNARPRRGLDLFAGGGLLDAKFGAGSTSGGVPVGGNKLPFSPDYTFNTGVQYSRPLRGDKKFYARGEGVFYGGFRYDDQNTAGQNAYAIANFRLGVSSDRWFAEAWARNAFDKNYVPIALPYPGLAPSGFIGEPGAPRTIGVTAGVRF